MILDRARAVTAEAAIMAWRNSNQQYFNFAFPLRQRMGILYRIPGDPDTPFNQGIPGSKMGRKHRRNSNPARYVLPPLHLPDYSVGCYPGKLLKQSRNMTPLR